MRVFQKLNQLFKRSPKLYIAVIFMVLILTYIASAIYHSIKAVPQGMGYIGGVHHSNIEILIDDSRVNAQGKTELSQQIFPKMLQMIHEAQSTIVVDMFLFNSMVGQQQDTQDWANQFTQALIQKRLEFPQINIQIMADPINSVYGGLLPKHYAQLRQAGIEVYEPNLAELRASNPVWTGFWAMCCQNLGNSTNGWLTSPFSSQDKVTLRSYLNLLNFKANHRKVMVVDSAQGWRSLISSANVHDGSSRHRNVAVVLHGKIAGDVLASEKVVGHLSGANIPSLIFGQADENQALPQVQILTDQAIFERAMQMIEQSQKGEQLKMMMFYLSDRAIINALKQAQQRGVEIQIILDQNLNAFGRKKNGVPNQPVATELNKAGIQVRWCNTQGEQCHAKVLIKQQADNVEVLLGSANFTRRNLENYNLESDVWLKSNLQNSQINRLVRYFDQSWHNQYGLSTLDYTQASNESRLQYWQYRFKEWSGFSTF